MRRAASKLDGGSLSLAAFAILVGSLAAVASGYAYGARGGNLEQLPMIFRALDSGYLANDFFVNHSDGFGPRFYYVHSIVWASKIVPLEAIHAVLTLLSYAGAAAVTAFAARDIAGSTVGAMIAATMAATLNPFYLGSDAALTVNVLTPEYLAMPFCLLALWMGIRGNAALAAAVSIPSIAIHPSIGLEAGAIALAAAAARRAVSFLKRPARPTAPSVANLILASAILAGAAVLLWLAPAILTGTLSTMETSEFARIYAYSRRPHHLIPSAWALSDYLMAAAFAGGLAIALTAFLRESLSGRRGARSAEREERRARAAGIGAILLAAALGFFAGWFFVEVVPAKWAILGQFFRLVSFVAWLGWIFVGWWIARALARREWHWGALGAASAVVPSSMLAHMSFSYASSLYARGAKKPSGDVGLTLFALAAGLAAVAYSFADTPSYQDLFPFAAGLAVAFAIAIFPRRVRAALTALAIVLALSVGTIAADRIWDIPDALAGAVRQPILTLNEYRTQHERTTDGAISLEMAARIYTDPDAVFLTPNFNTWRLLTDRASVIDWKGWPFSDEGTAEWDRRWTDVYERADYPNGVKNEADLMALREKYRFDYAILNLDVEHALPVIASDDRWQMVRMPPSGFPPSRE